MGPGAQKENGKQDLERLESLKKMRPKVCQISRQGRTITKTRKTEDQFRNRQFVKDK